MRVPEFKSERVFTNWVLKQARARGWRAAHLENMRVVRTPDGPRAVANRDATGFPDVVLVHSAHGLIFLELKMPGRKPSREQLDWLEHLRRVGGVRCWLFYPRDVETIVYLLDHGTTAQLEIGDELIDAGELSEL